MMSCHSADFESLHFRVHFASRSVFVDPWLTRFPLECGPQRHFTERERKRERESCAYFMFLLLCSRGYSTRQKNFVPLSRSAPGAALSFSQFFAWQSCQTRNQLAKIVLKLLGAHPSRLEMQLCIPINGQANLSSLLSS